MKKIILDKDQLVDLYVNQGLSQTKCGKILGCSTAVVKANLEEYGIQIRSVGYHALSKTQIDFTEEMYEVLRGALLGDGSLVKSGKMINARFTYTSKSFQHTKYVSSWFSEYLCSNGVILRKRHDNRTDNDYESSQFTTVVSPSLTEEYYKWYINKIKHIPNDLVLTPLMCKIWYIGDGSLITSTSCNSQRLMLYTNCFEKKELENTLLPQLSQFEPRLQLMGRSNNNNNKNYAISICKKENIKKFLNFIGECPFEDYKYKWDVKETLTRNFSKYCDEWNELYLNGLTTTQIAQKYKCSPTTVSKYLKEAR